MPVYAIKTFRRFQRKQRIGDVALMEAIERAEAGLVDGDLGGGLIKQRIARPGKGRSGGYRTIIAYRAGERAVFLLGFAKSALDNIDPATLAKWQAFGSDLIAASEEQIEDAIANDELTEIHHG